MKGIEGLERFTESFSTDNKNIIKADKVELRESISKLSIKLRESVNSDETEGWWVPISYYNKVNYNNRNYNKKLWTNVLQNQEDTWKGSFLLCDHPEGDSDGNPANAAGVWLDMKLGQPDPRGVGVVYGLLVPATRKGEDLADLLKKGGKIGTSSSGFGKLMADGVTVDPDTYVIERLADWVLNPSQGTYFAYDESGEVEDRSIRESKETEISEETENHPKDIYLNNVKEKVVKDSKITKLEEKKFRRDMESFLESASNIKDPQERLEEFKEIREYLEDGACPDLKEKVEQKIAEEEILIKEMLAESIEMKEELGIQSSKDLKEKLTRLSEDVKVIETESTKWKQIAEELQEKYNKTSNELKERPTKAYVSYLAEKNKKLAGDLKLQNEKAVVVVKNLTESYKSMREETEDLQKQIESLKDENRNLTESVTKSDSYKQLSEKANNLNQASYEKVVTALKEANEKIAKLSALVEEQRTLIEKTSVENATLKNLAEKKDKMAKRFSDENKETKRILETQTQRKRSQLHENSKTELDRYYESLVKTYGPQISKYESTIRNAFNLTEAKNIFYKKVLQNLKETASYEAKSQISNPVDRLPEGWF